MTPETCDLWTNSKYNGNDCSENTFKEQPQIFVTFEKFDKSDVETWPGQPNHSDLPIKTKEWQHECECSIISIFGRLQANPTENISSDQSKCAIDIQEMEKEKLCTYFFNIQYFSDNWEKEN